MSNKKATKRALLTSVMALAMCVVMLVGTTFAWFTDTARTGVNQIKAGKLDIELVKENGETPLGENDALSWVKAAGHENDTVLWEPNCTYELAGFQVKNAGNLAVKYKVVLNATNIKVVNGKSLLDVIDWTVKVGEGAPQTVTGNLKDGVVILSDVELLPEELSGVISVTGHMDANAGNDYQDMFIDGFGITVYATQAAVEYDSFGNTYDESATYPVTIAEVAAKYKADASVVPAGFVVEEKTNSEFDSGNNATGTITIKDAESLLYFAYVLDPAAAYEKCLADHTEQWGHTCVWYGGAYARHIKLDTDIDLENIVLSNGFGNMKDFDFDGQGHTIKNVTISNSGNRNIGLFQGGNRGISNLVVENVNVVLTSATDDSAVGIVSSDANANISNVTVKNSSVTGGKYTGAVVGYNYGSVTNCTVENTSVSGQYKVGGIIGYICQEAGNHVSVTNNTLKDVTVKGENILSGKTLALGKIVGNWNAIEGTCKDNSFSGTTIAANDIGKVESRAEAGLKK